MLKIDQLDLWYLTALSINFLIIVALIWALGLLKGFLFGVKAVDELATKGNSAFAVAYGGLVFALACMLTGVAAGNFAASLTAEAISMTVFGLIGVALILLGRTFQDKLVMREVDLHGQIKAGNLAAGIVDLGNMVAVAIVIRGVMLWVETEGFTAIPVILLAWIISQVVLSLAAKYRLARFANVQKGEDASCLQRALEEGNVGLSIRYAGYIIGTAFAITAASGLVAYQATQFWIPSLLWGAVSLGFALVFGIVVWLVRLLILPSVNVDEAVDKQKNAGVAVIEAVIFVAIGLTLANIYS